MKYRRKQQVGNIQFIVESNFKRDNADTAKEKLIGIMINSAKNSLSPASKTVSVK